nr:hypothetical protein [Roseiarcus fermentans]
MAFEVALQRVQAKRRLVEVADRSRRLESGENKPDFLDQVGGDLLRSSSSNRRFKPLCLKLAITSHRNL